YLSIEEDSRRAMTILIPDSLKYGIAGVEPLYSTVIHSPQSARYVFDMRDVPFLQPCGVIALLSAARYCSSLSGHRVIIINLNEQLYSYLDRMDLFKGAERWLVPIGNIADRWRRSSHTANLLELTKIRCPED